MKKLLLAGPLAFVLALTLCSPRADGFVTYGSPPAKWGGGLAPSSSGGDVNWVFNEAGTADMTGGPVTQDGEFTTLIACLLEWEDATGGNLDLQYTGTTTVGMVTGDGLHVATWIESGWGYGSSAIGVCVFDYSGSAMVDADVGFNGENFTWSDALLLKKVALHEFGHAIGLGHETGVTAIMNPVVGSVSVLQTDDIAGAQALYGLGGGGDGVVPAPPPPDPEPEPAPTPSPEPAPGPVDRGGSPSPTPPSGGGGSSSNDDGDQWVDDDDDDYGGGVKGRYHKYKDKYCVVATAACGSADASRVDSLRALRDRSLRGTRSGGGLVGLYERSAAPAARIVRRSEVLRALVREALPR